MNEEWWNDRVSREALDSLIADANETAADWEPEDLRPQTWPKPAYGAEGDLIAPAPSPAAVVSPGMVQISWTPDRSRQTTRLQIEFTDELLMSSRLSVLETVLFAVREHLMNAGLR